MYEFFLLIILKLIEGMPIWGVSAGLAHLAYILYYNEKKFIAFLIIISLSVYILVVYPILFVGSGIGADSLSELNNFNLDEAIFWFLNIISINWIPSNRHLQLYIFGFLSYIIFWVLFNIVFKKKKNIYKNFEYIIIFLIVTIPFSLKIYNVAISYSAMTEQHKNLTRNFTHELNDLKLTKKDDKLNVLLYIGESTSSMHMNIYGYPRKNTPLLKKIKSEDKNLIIFDNVWSTHTHTSSSLLRALSFDCQKKSFLSPLTIMEEKRLSITDLLNKADIKTNLYSNQGKTGSWNLASSVIFKNGNKSFSIENGLIGNKADLQRKPFDHVYFNKFFEDISSRVDNTGSLNVFHSYAGHGPYIKFIPENYKKKIDDFYSKFEKKIIFGESKYLIYNQIEEYDSAIKYIDYSLYNSIDKVKNSNKPIVFVYFSDHGESPFTSRGHDSSKFINEMARIPFLIYFNDIAKALRPELFNKYKQLSNYKNTGTLEQLPSTILELFAIEIDSPSCLKDNMLMPIGFENKKNQIVTRKIGDKYSYVKINHSTYLKQKNYIDNTDTATKNYLYTKKFGSENLGICYHRSNSLAKMIRGNFNSNCIELDIVIKENKILISHDLSDDSNLNLSIIDQVLSPNNKLWIDGKNINKSDNCNLILSFFKIRPLLSKNTLIEFPSNTKGNINLNECISSLKSLGVSTAFYVPTKDGIECQKVFKKLKNYQNSEQCIKFYNLINKAVKTKYYSDLSFDYEIYEIVSMIDIVKSLKLNTWNINFEEIDKLNLNNFHLIIPKNEDPNYR